MKYSPRPINNLNNAVPVPKMSIICAGHGDHDRLLAVLCEAKEILEEDGPRTERRTGQGWMYMPRESFGQGGLEEMV